MYRPFGKEVRTITIHPYHLKQYNNRWFLIGKQSDYNEQLANIAIDRIEALKETPKAYESLEEDFSFEEYFGDVVGVSVNNNPVEEVVLHINNSVMGYVITKPLHESQSFMPKKLDNDRWEITLKVKNNYELKSLIRSFGEQIEVMSPESLRQEMKQSLDRMSKMYSLGK